MTAFQVRDPPLGQRLVPPAVAVLHHHQPHVRLERDRRPTVPLRRAATSVRLAIPLRLDRRKQRLLPQQPHPSAPDRPAARAASPATARPTDSPPGHPAASASRPPSPPENRTFPGKLRGSGRTAPGRGAAPVSPRKQQAQPQNGATSPKQRLRAADHIYPGEVASSALLVT